MAVGAADAFVAGCAAAAVAESINVIGTTPIAVSAGDVSRMSSRAAD
jgi:hypothetical protein